MQKGFTRRPRPDAPGTAGPNYITPGGLQRLKDEVKFLLTRERPAVTEVVTWAVSHGDRSENADDEYGKRRLRQIDSRLRFLMKRIGAAKVVDPVSALSEPTGRLCRDGISGGQRRISGRSQVRCNRTDRASERVHKWSFRIWTEG